MSQESYVSLVERLWERDVTLWPGDDDVRAAIRDRLGWLDSPRWLADNQTELSDWARDIRARGFSQVVLVGTVSYTHLTLPTKA